MGLYTRLKEQFPRMDCEREFDFSRHTTIGCGGRAEAAASPADEQEAQALLVWLRRENIPY